MTLPQAAIVALAKRSSGVLGLRLFKAALSGSEAVFWFVAGCGFVGLITAALYLWGSA